MKFSRRPSQKSSETSFSHLKTSIRFTLTELGQVCVRKNNRKLLGNNLGQYKTTKIVVLHSNHEKKWPTALKNRKIRRWNHHGSWFLIGANLISPITLWNVRNEKLTPFIRANHQRKKVENFWNFQKILRFCKLIISVSKYLLKFGFLAALIRGEIFIVRGLRLQRRSPSKSENVA